MSFHPTTTTSSASFDKEKPSLSQKFEVLDSRNHPRSTRMRGLYPPKITLKLFRIRTFTFKLPSFKSYVTPFGTEMFSVFQPITTAGSHTTGWISR